MIIRSKNSQFILKSECDYVSVCFCIILFIIQYQMMAVSICIFGGGNASTLVCLMHNFMNTLHAEKCQQMSFCNSFLIYYRQ